MAEIYSKNKLKNPDAEIGTLAEWTYSNAAVVAGGPTGSVNCFRLATTGYLKQVISASTQPPDIKVGGFFLPELPTIGSVEKKVFIRVTHHYGDGSKDVHLVPCVESGVI